jgi:glycosyltransferase involved in cell wall biosynthesis
MLYERGHDVSIFTQGDVTTLNINSGPIVHTVSATRETFAGAVLPIFSSCHASKPFDVIESAEYGADALAISSTHDSLARVVRLHTPTFMVSEIDQFYARWYAQWRPSRIRFILGALRRGRVPRRFRVYDPLGDRERLQTLAADVVTAPSRSIIERLQRTWNIPSELIEHIPNVFVPPSELLRVTPETNTQRVTFMGRLEPRKGIIELAKAIPIVLRAVPSTKFRVVGRSGPHPNTGEDLKLFMRRVLGSHAGAVEFIDGVPYAEIPQLFAETDICVFPSVWENFPYVCLEAMAAARGIIGSSAGGMAEIIEPGRTGLLVPPRDHKAIGNAILELLRDPQRRIAIGGGAREHVLRAYAPDAIARRQEESYVRAINAARRRHPNRCGG